MIYADPPWRYEFAQSDTREIENHYPTMDLEAICSLPIGELACGDALLFLWATSLPRADQREAQHGPVLCAAPSSTA